MLQPKDIDWLNDYKKRPVPMLSTRDPVQIYSYIQIEREKVEEGFHANGSQNEAGSNNTHI